MKMIDKCECMIFLNTPSSIDTDEAITSNSTSTKSPWIFSELSMTSLIRKRTVGEHRREGIIKLSEGYVRNDSLDVDHPVVLDHLIDIDATDLAQWQHNKEFCRERLDGLYRMKNLLPLRRENIIQLHE